MEARINRWYTLRCVKVSVFVFLPKLIALEGDGSSVTFYIDDSSDPRGYRTETAGKNLKKFEDCFGSDYIRINQSQIVNLHYVEKMVGYHTLFLRKPLPWELSITDTYRKQFKAALGLGK